MKFKFKLRHLLITQFLVSLYGAVYFYCWLPPTFSVGVDAYFYSIYDHKTTQTTISVRPIAVLNIYYSTQPNLFGLPTKKDCFSQTLRSTHLMFDANPPWDKHEEIFDKVDQAKLELAKWLASSDGQRTIEKEKREWENQFR